ncbi:hypothetical protein PHLGIDRAFT_287311 [Phlebiopsis gigantea 11061_1 CR5-6]|uniref:Uncharacterized protein n=1 Tax=Phlebiopsis gigantea (strain 11061_1 CR5-6) TaxID=745531 RepID=A0A0C3S0M5_PHLG1|nr:hypothetical protein PHLGIDRAFT_287311 [Phlebiopsis gigantea 11061_1 CR5-6]
MMKPGLLVRAALWSGGTRRSARTSLAASSLNKCSSLFYQAQRHITQLVPHQTRRRTRPRSEEQRGKWPDIAVNPVEGKMLYLAAKSDVNANRILEMGTLCHFHGMRTVGRRAPHHPRSEPRARRVN